MGKIIIHRHGVKDAARFMTKQDIRLPSDPVWGNRAGKIMPSSTIVYKEGNGFRPWFHNGSGRLHLESSDVQSADSKVGDAAPCSCKNKAHDASFNAQAEHRNIVSKASEMVRACKNVYLLAQQAGDQAAASEARKVWDAAEKMHSLIHQNA